MFSSPSPTWTAGRALLALAVVFVMLATTGWTAVRRGTAPPGAYDAEAAAWRAASAGGRPLPRPDAPPQRLAAFFASLTARDAGRLAERFPLVVGNLNGAPVTLRYRANRIALQRELTRERTREQERIALGALSPDGRRDAARRQHRLQALMGDDRQVLAFDPSGAGRVAEVLGDLDRAQRVSVVVPGVDTNLLTFERTQRKYTAPAGMAESLYAAGRAAAPGIRTAVIAWADYTAPVGVGVESAMGRLAEGGSDRLVALTGALPGASRISLVCHSYGSVVCGVAAHRLTPRVTDIAVAGSPGMRAGNVDELGARARVWAARDRDDWIEDVPHLEVGGFGHGTDPVSPEFGARVVSTEGAIGHTGYFEPGTESVTNFANMAVGSYDGVSCASADATCRRDISGEAAS